MLDVFSFAKYVMRHEGKYLVTRGVRPVRCVDQQHLGELDKHLTHVLGLKGDASRECLRYHKKNRINDKIKSITLILLQGLHTFESKTFVKTLPTFPGASSQNTRIQSCSSSTGAFEPFSRFFSLAIRFAMSFNVGESDECSTM